MNHFELALGVEVKQPMDLTIPKNETFATRVARRSKRWPRNMKRGNHKPSSF
jgi:hypothetical protein